VIHACFYCKAPAKDEAPTAHHNRRVTFTCGTRAIVGSHPGMKVRITCRLACMAAMQASFPPAGGAETPALFFNQVG
jgi:hypothetical protein